MHRRDLLRGSIGIGAAALAGCSGLLECGPGEDTFADVEDRVGDGELEGDQTAVDVSFEAEVVEVVDNRELIVDDTTAEAELYTGLFYELDTDLVDAGDCVEGEGSAHAADNADSDRLVVQIDDLMLG